MSYLSRRKLPNLIAAVDPEKDCAMPCSKTQRQSERAHIHLLDHAILAEINVVDMPERPKEILNKHGLLLR